MVCMCPSHPVCVPTPWLKCIHASVHVFMSTWIAMLPQPPMHSYMETWVFMCVTVCVPHLPCFACGLTPWLKCVHASVHVYMSTWLPMSAPPELNSFMETCGTAVWHYVHPSHPTSGPIPWLECLHVSVHVFMSTWLPMLVKPPKDNYMETWLPHVSLCVHPSHPACGSTPWLKCVHASLHVLMSTWLPMSASPH